MKKLMIACLFMRGLIYLSACNNHADIPPAPVEEAPSSSSQESSSSQAMPDIKNNAYDKIDIEGKDLNGFEQCLVWSWQHASPEVGSGYAAVYFFMADKSYVFSANTMVGADRLRYHEGYWEIADNQLTIYTTKRVFIEGGEVIAGWGSMINDIEGGELVAYLLDPPEQIIVPVDELFSQSTDSQKVILIENEPYCKFNISPSYLDNIGYVPAEGIS